MLGPETIRFIEPKVGVAIAGANFVELPGAMAMMLAPYKQGHCKPHRYGAILKRTSVVVLHQIIDELHVLAF